MAAGRRGTAAVAGLGTLVLGLAACGGGTRDGDGGGTLRLVGASDVDHLDPASAYTQWSAGLVRQFARTLFGVRAADTFAEAVEVRPDVAAELPTVRNGGVSADGRTYTIRLRPGVRWNTRPPREVTAADFVRGLKRVCNPAQPAGARGYYTGTIVGMDAFCRGFAGVDAGNAAAIAAYQNEHEVEGLKARDARTLEIRLKRPTQDFVEILAMGFAAAAPAEYDRYVPDSAEFRVNTVSNGPYRIGSYTPGKRYVLERNPAWRQESDPLRGQGPARIQITLGQDSPEAVQRRLEEGTADLAWDQTVPAARIPALRSHPNFKIMQGSSLDPYLVFNTLSPNNGGALGRREVRRAIAYAIDKAALVRLRGGPGVGEVLHQAIPPRSTGHEPFNPYPTPGDAGDPDRCWKMLVAAGYPNGLKLRFPYRTSGDHARIAQSLRADLKECGIDAELVADSAGTLYNTTLVTPADARAGRWDVAAPDWHPDWYGDNGRTIVPQLFDGRLYGPNSANFGGYDNDEVNRLIDRALAAGDEDEARRLWARADRLIMADAAIVPLMSRNQPVFHSSRVRDARYLPHFQTYDVSLVRLA
ncbi:ABC transporter substrate-binding protein [Actinomadura kijaniata]|uniref:Peptide/nickel transport system substrate-binding protein n=1 Tax=Actinomadura namibiensis TaxID=182080 RepID=A0A7W3QQ79_ACTNM|nr:ABC transporter substrate-binding protein [Actinomadura namibiensis]MBA8955377.1 peptide/nickel transport system substrate-binding protein [Actinomadura namibiensis]